MYVLLGFFNYVLGLYGAHSKAEVYSNQFCFVIVTAIKSIRQHI